MIPDIRKLTGAAFLAVAACGAGPEIQPPAQTGVQLSITGAANMNGGAPAKVKVYYLSDAAAFRAADFFAVFDTPDVTLGADLVAVSEFQLAPGRTVTDTKTFATPPAAVGVVAAFRDIDGTFLAVKPLVPNALNPTRITLSGNSVTIR
ncbi:MULTISPECIES: type VI secretion system lipoprotein TssJ [Rhodobacterales]|uniref:type VI secretion system lipoprotein TssJ n=1 Tax=Rhodobacterales TaxID=204455 RepID=UPI0015F03099|nr:MULTISPECIES: type VI secretion system lipoprotein TssJ [Rhodobacterales]MDO6590554.1 type VI secretion system lipoprotein TssJ [Yoonia sp. 1_MG-2023]